MCNGKSVWEVCLLKICLLIYHCEEFTVLFLNEVVIGPSSTWGAFAVPSESYSNITCKALPWTAWKFFFIITFSVPPYDQTTVHICVCICVSHYFVSNIYLDFFSYPFLFPRPESNTQLDTLVYISILNE